jgi:hypothetical protein
VHPKNVTYPALIHPFFASSAQNRRPRGRQPRFQRRVPRPGRAKRRVRAGRARLVAAPRALRASPLGLALLGEWTART